MRVDGTEVREKEDSLSLSAWTTLSKHGLPFGKLFEFLKILNNEFFKALLKMSLKSHDTNGKKTRHKKNNIFEKYHKKNLHETFSHSWFCEL